MHELSIASQIIGIATNEVHKINGSRIDELELDIGEFSGIDFENLSFILKSLLSKSIHKNCKIHINYISSLAQCHECSCQFHANNLYDSCPRCNSTHTSLIKGTELKVKSLIIE